MAMGKSEDYGGSREALMREMREQEWKGLQVLRMG